MTDGEEATHDVAAANGVSRDNATASDATAPSIGGNVQRLASPASSADEPDVAAGTSGDHERRGPTRRPGRETSSGPEAPRGADGPSGSDQTDGPTRSEPLPDSGAAGGVPGPLPSALHPPPTAAEVLFGDRLGQVARYVELLADTGVAYGLIGPREGERIWDRHVLNCAVLAELIEPNARLLDIGSGAGLPGIPLALARQDLEIVLLEPLARRVDWLRATVRELGLPVTVVRGRAEEREVRREWRGADVVTARAVAPLAKLAGWALPLLRTGGRLLAVKGESASVEVTRDRATVRDFGGSVPRVVQCGATHVDPPTTVVVIERLARRFGDRTRRGQG